MAPADTFSLCWNGRPLGVVGGVAVWDWPWKSGRFAPGDWPADLRVALERIHDEATSDSDEEASDPGGPPGLFEGWTLTDPKGTPQEIAVPLVDFAAGEILWR